MFSTATVEASGAERFVGLYRRPDDDGLRVGPWIIAFRSAYPASLAFEMQRTTGSGDLWVNEYTISYDGAPSPVVGIMEFREGKVFRETVYVTESWEPPAWRAQWVEAMDQDDN